MILSLELHGTLENACCQNVFGNMSVWKMPVGKMPVGKMPVGKMPVGKMPVSRRPVQSDNC
jgi:hypothetical protein